MNRSFTLSALALTVVAGVLVAPACPALGSAVAEAPASFTATDGLTINGVISRPAGPSGAALPGILLIHGSGPLDRDLYLPGSVTADGKPARMFKELAAGLAAAGAVVYRYDKRGITQDSAGLPLIDASIYMDADVQDLKRDVHGALAVLRADPLVDPRRIILLGLSEGTALAPLVALEDGGISALILLSSMGSGMRETLYFQLVERSLNVAKDLVDADGDGFILPAEAAAFPGLSLPFAVLDADGDARIALSELKAVLMRQYYAFLDASLAGPQKDWFAQHLALAPNFKVLPKFRGSILMVHGEIDAQTPLADALLNESALRAAGHPEHELIVLPGLGHGFSPHLGKGGHLPTIGPMSPAVVTLLQDWLRRRMGP